jgi:2-oxoglutarate dehydrogenase E2 component (dihydrolipoamide succinyltransferase)
MWVHELSTNQIDGMGAAQPAPSQPLAPTPAPAVETAPAPAAAAAAPLAAQASSGRLAGLLQKVGDSLTADERALLMAALGNSASGVPAPSPSPAAPVITIDAPASVLRASVASADTSAAASPHTPSRHAEPDDDAEDVARVAPAAVPFDGGLASPRSLQATPRAILSRPRPVAAAAAAGPAASPVAVAAAAVIAAAPPAASLNTLAAAAQAAGAGVSATVRQEREQRVKAEYMRRVEALRARTALSASALSASATL